MIYINGEKIDADKKSPYYIEYINFIEEAKKRNKPFIFKYKDEAVYDTNVSGHRVLRKRRTFNLPLVDNYDNNEIWYYDPSYHKIEVDLSGYKRIKGKTSFIYRNDIVLQSDSLKDIELAFFIIKFSSLYRNGIVYLHDEDEIAKKLVEREEIMARVHSLIFLKDSPISKEVVGNEEVMRNLAIKWGVSGVDSLSYQQVKIALWNAINNLASNNRFEYFEKFIEDVEMTRNTYITSIVNYALEKKVIEYNAETFYYEFVGSGGERTNLINVRGLSVGEAINKLIDFVSFNEIWLNTLEERLKVFRKEDKARSVQELQNILLSEDLNWNEVARVCKKYNIKTVTANGGRKSREELFNEIREKIKELTY